MIDIAHLRALLAAAFNAVLPLRYVGHLHAEGNNWGIEDVNGFDVAGDLYQADAEAIVAAVNGAGPLLDELEALRRDAVVVREGHWDALVAERDAWRNATHSATPADLSASVAQSAIDYAEMQSRARRAEEDRDVLRAELAEQDIALGRAECLDAAWRQATGCNTPEEAGEAWDRLDTLVDESAGTQPVQHVSKTLTALDRHLFDQRQTIGKQERELARLRELERATLACEDWPGCDHPSPPPKDPEDMDAGPCDACNAIFEEHAAAIAACRAAKEATDADR